MVQPDAVFDGAEDGRCSLMTYQGQMWDELVSSVILSNMAITLVGILEATQEEDIKIEFFYERLFFVPFEKKKKFCNFCHRRQTNLLFIIKHILI